MWRILFGIAVCGLYVVLPVESDDLTPCSSYSSCKTCTSKRHCGWCDSSQTCTEGEAAHPSSSTCTHWFFHNCMTSDDSTTCSEQIRQQGCIERVCAHAKTPKEIFSCQKCQDFHSCFKETEDTCKTWDEVKCPGGYLKPDLSDPDRLKNAVLNPAVLRIDPKSTTMYMCKMSGPDGPVPIVATENKDLNYTGRVLSSEQAGGLMHKVEHVIPRGSWTFLLTKKAELPEVVQNAEFEYKVTNANSEPDFMEDENPKFTIIERLETTNSSKYNSHDMSGVRHMYRLVGHTIKDKHNVTERRSVLVVPKAKAMSCINIGDVVYANDTVGFLEEVKVAQSLSDEEIILKTQLVQLQKGKELPFFQLETLKATEAKSFSCAGGNLTEGLSVYPVGFEEPWMGPGQIIVGREASTVAIQIAAIHDGGDFILYEGYPVVSVGENGELTTSFGPNDPAHQLRKKRASVGFEKELSKSFEVPYEASCVDFIKKYCDICQDVKCGINLNVKPSITLAVALNVEFGLFSGIDVNAGIGAQAVVEASASYEVSVTLRKEWTFKKSASLFGPKTVGRFMIPIAGVPIPGTIDVEYIQTLEASAKGELTVGSSGSGKVVIAYSGKYGDVRLPTAPDNEKSVNPTADFEPFKSSANVTAAIKNTGTLKLSATWPSAGSGLVDAAANLVKDWPLPGWVKGKITDALNVKVDVYMQVLGSFKQTLTAETCKCCGTDPSKPHSLEVKMGPSLTAEGGAHIISLNPKFKAFDYYWELYDEGWCLPPNLGLCAALNTGISCGCSCPDGSTGIISEETQTCQCPCTCPGGTKSTMNEEGKCICKCKCSNGIESNEMENGDCDCADDCPESCEDNLEPVTVDGLCRCPPPSYECGMSPDCEVGRKGPSCTQPSCKQYNDCSGNGNCIADQDCAAHCECNEGFKGDSCNIEPLACVDEAQNCAYNDEKICKHKGSYKGIKVETSSGIPCANWTIHYANYVGGRDNHCRSMIGRGPWCIKSGWTWDHLPELPHELCFQTCKKDVCVMEEHDCAWNKDSICHSYHAYNGTKSVTRSGQKCQERTGYEADLSGAHAFCRAIEAMPGMDALPPSCLNESGVMEHCFDDCDERTLFSPGAPLPDCSTNFKSCKSCSQNKHCGWCDTTHTCTEGSAMGPSSSYCPSWFFHNCVTNDKSSSCSKEIKIRKCGCTNPKTPKEVFNCQKCQDFYSCFKDNEDACKTWDETKCPGGYLKPNLSDPDRLKKAVLNPAVLRIDPKDTTMYMCKMSGPNGPVPLVATESKGVNYTGRILSSEQAGGLMHKVEHVIPRGSWTFLLTKKAELPEVVENAEFEYKVTNARSEPDFMEDENPKSEIINRLNVTTSSKYTSHDMSGVKHLYRLVGTTIVDRNKVPERRSVLAVPKTNVKSCITIEDVIYANDTVGFLEEVKEVQQLSDEETLMKTHLVQLETGIEYFQLEALKLTEAKSFSCAGGDLTEGLSVYPVGFEEPWMAPGQIIVGREASTVAIQVAAIHDGGDFILYEGYPVVSVGENGELTTSFGPNDPAHQLRKKRASVGFEKELSKSFEVPYEASCVDFIKKYCDICQDVKCGINLNVKPSITLAVALNVEFGLFSGIDVNAGIGAQAVVEASASYEVSVTLRKEWTFKKSASLFGPKTVGRFMIPIAGVPIPGTIDVEYIQTLEASAKGELTVGSSGSGKVVIAYSGKYGDVRLPTAPDNEKSVNPTADFEPFKSSAKVTAAIKNTGTLKLSATWPSAGSGLVDAAANLVKDWPLPGWVKGKITDALNVKVDVYMQVLGSFKQTLTAETCKCCGTDPSKPHSLEVKMGPSLTAEGGAHIISLNPKFKAFDYYWELYDEGWCLPPNLGLCAALNTGMSCGCSCPDGSTGIISEETQTCQCPCTCPGGTKSTMNEEGKCICKCKCSNGIESNEMENGDCDCADDCPESCEDNLEPVTVDGLCRCPPPSFECGVSPGCDEGRKGKTCTQACCKKYNDCSGNGNCIADDDCAAHCECINGYSGEKCDIEPKVVTCVNERKQCALNNDKLCKQKGAYNGTKAETKTGIPCKTWSSNYANMIGGGNHNMCRSMNRYAPFCIKDGWSWSDWPEKPWDFCFDTCA